MDITQRGSQGSRTTAIAHHLVTASKEQRICLFFLFVSMPVENSSSRGFSDCARASDAPGKAR